MGEAPIQFEKAALSMKVYSEQNRKYGDKFFDTLMSASNNRRWTKCSTNDLKVAQNVRTGEFSMGIKSMNLDSTMGEWKLHRSTTMLYFKLDATRKSTGQRMIMYFRVRLSMEKFEKLILQVYPETARARTLNKAKRTTDQIRTVYENVRRQARTLNSGRLEKNKAVTPSPHRDFGLRQRVSKSIRLPAIGEADSRSNLFKFQNE